MKSKNLKLKILKENFAVCKIKSYIDFRELVKNEQLFSLTVTPEEISVVCDEINIPLDSDADLGWKCIKIEEKLDFSLIGIIADISSIMAKEKISIFVISTYNTDYVLIKANNIIRAEKALKEEGYILVN